jgi:hypothetical protein
MPGFKLKRPLADGVRKSRQPREGTKKMMTIPRKLIILSLSLFALMPNVYGSATSVYVTPSGASTGNCPTGTSTAPNFTPAQFSSSANWGTGTGKIGAGTTILVCGTFTGSANSTLLTWHPEVVNGSSAAPITMTFDTNTVLQSPYWASSVGGESAGAITLGSGGTYLVVDLNHVTIQNTANGSPPTYPNQQPSTGISAFACNHCTVTNSGAQSAAVIANLYVNIQGDGTLNDNSVVRAIDYSGSNWNISNVTIHDCGWCVISNSYGNGDTNNSLYNLNVYNFGHAFNLAASGPDVCPAPCYFLHDNQIHDAANWSASGCPFHQDGLHTFGTTGSSMDGVYVYNNYFYGDWGTCPTGFIFVEAAGGGTPSHMKSSYWWNNVFIVQNTSFENTNGWVDIASGDSGVQWIYNNTIVGHGGGPDNTLCFGVEYLSQPIFENNVTYQCGNPLSLQNTATSSATIDYNYYGAYACQNLNNCFTNYNGGYVGSFSSWRSYCSCDSHAIFNTSSTLFNADGSPQAGSPVIGAGINLSSSATGYLASLQSDTTKGGTRTPIARPASSPWDIGAYEYTTSNNAPNPPSGLTAIVR